MQCTSLILQDHEALRRALNILDWMVKKLEDGARIEIADAVTILDFLRDFGDEYHQAMEENVFYPAVLRVVPEQSPLRRMLSEHADERLLVAGIEEALRCRKGMSFAQNTRRLTTVLGNHLDKEDAVLVQTAERWLSKEDDDFVIEQLRKNYQRPEIQVNFSRLEWKYEPTHPLSTPLIADRALARVRGAAT